MTTKLDNFIKSLQDEIDARKAKALKVRADQGECQAYYVVHEVDGLEDALKLARKVKRK